MSIVAYNGIVLPYVQTIDFDQTPVYDEIGHTDRYLTRFDIRVLCLINYQYMALIAPNLFVNGALTTTNAADIMVAIRQALMERGKQLSVKFNGVELIPQRQITSGSSQLSGTSDAKNGPVPQGCKIVNLTSDLFLVQYHIVAHYWENTSTNPSALLPSPINTNQKGCPVLYNRWTETIEYDQLQMARYRREGQFAMRSDNPDGVTIEAYRAACATLAVPKGFVRESFSFTMNPDGLGMKYSIVDKEVFATPPFPAFDAQGEYRETAAKNGAFRFGEARVLLRGQHYDTGSSSVVGAAVGLPGAGALEPGSSQGRLIQVAIAIVVKILRAKAQVQPGSFAGALGAAAGAAASNFRFGIIESASIRVGIYENLVEFHMRVWNKALQGRIQGTSMDHVYYGAPFSDPNNGPDYHLYGNSFNPIALQAAKYYNPNVFDNAINPATGSSNHGIPIGQAGTTLETPGVDQNIKLK